VVNQIVSVVHGEDGDRCYVTLSETLESFDDPSTLIEVSVDGSTWLGPENVLPDETTLELIFAADVSDRTLWRVTQPGDWHFADAATLDGPYEGSIG
jgi:hypothetical protein